MPAILEPIEAPLAPDQLVERWQAICRDPTFEDIAGKIELTEQQSVRVDRAPARR